MGVSFRNGDLFSFHDFDALAHGCNCRGVMGAGIAFQFARRWPSMVSTYRHNCKAGNFRLGQAMVWQSPDGLTIYNLATQDKPGRNARLDAVRDSVTAMLMHARSNGIKRIGIPQIGSGIGGLAWSDVQGVLEDLATSDDVELVVCIL